WPSMDVAADMLAAALRIPGANTVDATLLRPIITDHFGWSRWRIPLQVSANVDRAFNRFWDYPRWLRSQRRDFDLFHVIDHSYAHLVHELASHRTVVTCHDLDTFRSLLVPDQEPRSWLFRAITRRILAGFRSAGRVICDTRAIRDELVAHGLIPPDRTS